MFLFGTMFKKYLFAGTVLLYFLTGGVDCNVELLEPGQCLSKFDFDYKVMQKLLQLEGELKELKQSRDTKQVAFMAGLSEHLVNPKGGTNVVFDDVYTNTGDGYKPGPGVFIAPVQGTFSFSLVVSSPTKAASAALHLSIMRNTDRAGYIFLDQNSDRWLHRSTTVVLELNEGDSVFVKVSKADPGRIAPGTLFSGFLIN